MTDPKDLKIAALREAVANNTSSYEERIADLRVALTQKDEQLSEALQRVNSLESRISELDNSKKESPEMDDDR